MHMVLASHCGVAEGAKRPQCGSGILPLVVLGPRGFQPLHSSSIHFGSGEACSQYARLADRLRAGNIMVMALELNALETRILGCLLEKERLTPENYPLSLNSLTAACNQTTNRDPVTSYDEKSVEEGVNSLRERKLAMSVFGAGSRVQKYKHRFEEHYVLERPELALICVLLLRGPQTLGELRTRTERFYGFASLDAVRERLEELEKPGTELVLLLPQQPGQKEQRYIQRLSAADVFEQPATEAPLREVPATGGLSERVSVLEKTVGELQAELQRVREEFAAFRKQFE